MRKPKVLVVDDSGLVRKWCTKVLEENGMQVNTCRDGKQGLNRVFSYRPDVIITDLEMPVMDGLKFIKALRKCRDTAHLPVIAFTSKNDLEDKVRVLTAGANDFLHKESDEAELVARVKSQFRLKLLEDDLINERNKFYNILNDLVEAVVIVDHRRRVVFMNVAARDLLEVSSGEEGGIDLEELLAGSPHAKNLMHSLDHDGTIRGELELGEGEEKRFFEVSAAPVFLAAGEAPGKTLILRDVSQEKKMEEMKAVFYSMIAHDLRSPITVINGYLKLILSGKAGEINETQREFLSDTRNRANAMLRLVDEFLTFSEFNTSFVDLELTEVDVERILREVMHSLEFIAESKNIEAKLEVNGKIPRIIADPDKLHKVFINLYDNALKYTMDGGRVRLLLTPVEGGIQVGVSDNGIGIDEEEMKYVFDRFRRMSTAKKKRIKGTGLGLAIVKEIVDAHHGRVWVESEAGKGSTFFVFLPSNKGSRLEKGLANESRDPVLQEMNQFGD
jgi:signal transduction histidine kinase